MSRCFPFPPPGYEKKARTDNADLPLKENCIDKKDKKEKRDKHKSEGKEKKHKDSSKKKHGEKKEHKEKDRKRKDKDRDKKKDKDKDRNKGRLSNDKLFEEQTGNSHEEKNCENSQKAVLPNDFEPTELHDRIKDGRGNPKVENIVNKSLATHFETSIMAENGRRADNMEGDLTGRRGRIAAKGNMLVEEAICNNMVNNCSTADQKRYVGTSRIPEKGRGPDAKIGRNLTSVEEQTRVMEVEGAAGHNMVNSTTAEQRSYIGTSRLVEKGWGTDARMATNLCASEDRTGTMGNTLVEGAIGFNVANSSNNGEWRSFDGVDGLLEKDPSKRIKEKEKAKHGEADARKREKHKDIDREKSNKDKDTDKQKEKKKEKGKMKKDEQKEHKSTREASKKEQDAISMKPLFPHQDTEKYAGLDGNCKRKQINGFVLENDLQPFKLPRMASFSHLPVQNGRNVDIHHVATSSPSDWHGDINNIVLEKTADNEGQMINGVAVSLTPEVALKTIKPTDASENADASPKPHPDSKYLSKILSVPTMEKLFERDDQEWLSRSDDFRQKPKAKLKVDEIPQVWSKAVKIEEADVLALPYVLPY